MEDREITTVKFVGPNDEERCVVQLYVTCRKFVGVYAAFNFQRVPFFNYVFTIMIRGAVA